MFSPVGRLPNSLERPVGGAVGWRVKEGWFGRLNTPSCCFNIYCIVIKPKKNAHTNMMTMEWVLRIYYAGRGKILIYSSAKPFQKCAGKIEEVLNGILCIFW